MAITRKANMPLSKEQMGDMLLQSQERIGRAFCDQFMQDQIQKVRAAQEKKAATKHSVENEKVSMEN